MSLGGEPDQIEIAGYSLRNEEARAQWRSLLEEVSAWMEDNRLGTQIVFHGTSKKRLAAILEEGMRPTDVDIAVQGDADLGSFWGNVRTAAAYAEDTAKERDGSVPVLLAVRVEVLERDCELYPDLATLDFPLKGLTRLCVPGVYEKWMNDEGELSWRDSLVDLGAIVAAHDFYLAADDIVVVKSVGDLEALRPTMAPAL